MHIGEKLTIQEVENSLARELQKRKLENEAKKKFYDKICSESEEIKQLKQKLQTAYVTKERTGQIAENQIRRIMEQRTQADLDEEILKKKEREEREQRLRDQERKQKLISGKLVLQHQMQEKKMATLEAQQQYLKEKDEVDKIIHKLIEEDKKSAENISQKKQVAFEQMQEALAMKEEKRLQDKKQEQMENEKYLQFIREKDAQAAEIKQKKEETNAKREEVLLKLKEEEERKRRDREELEELRQELYREEYEEMNRRKEIEEAAKRQRMKEEMIKAEHEAKAYKEEQKRKEAMMEKEFTAQMLAKFAEDDKIEQMNAQKRRMKKLEHVKEVERMWQEKLKLFREEQEKEREMLRKIKEEELMKLEIIQIERERLLREHVPYVKEFLPKGTLRSEDENQYANRPVRLYKTNYKV